MPDILHRLTIDAPRDRVHEMVATKTGLQRWWSGHPVGGDEHIDGKLLFYFGGEDPSAVMQVIGQTPARVAWRCIDGPPDWLDTEISFELKPSTDGDTTLLFSHTGWREPGEFMHHCSTHWASYLIGLKAGLEGANYTPFPQGEVNHWP